MQPKLDGEKCWWQHWAAVGQYDVELPHWAGAASAPAAAAPPTMDVRHTESPSTFCRRFIVHTGRRVFGLVRECEGERQRLVKRETEAGLEWERGAERLLPPRVWPLASLGRPPPRAA